MTFQHSPVIQFGWPACGKARWAGGIRIGFRVSPSRQLFGAFRRAPGTYSSYD